MLCHMQNDIRVVHDVGARVQMKMGEGVIFLVVKASNIVMWCLVCKGPDGDC